jgi:hypothetical protein
MDTIWSTTNASAAIRERFKGRGRNADWRLAQQAAPLQRTMLPYHDLKK